MPADACTRTCTHILNDSLIAQQPRAQQVTHLSEGLEDVGARDRYGHVHIMDNKERLLQGGVGEVGQVVRQVEQQPQRVLLQWAKPGA